MRNLESARSPPAFFRAPGTLRLTRIDREQVPSRNGRVGPALGGGEKAAPASDTELGRKRVVGCGAVRLCTLVVGWHGEAERLRESLERRRRQFFGGFCHPLEFP